MQRPRRRHPLPGVVLVGAVSGVGGGVLRDMIVRARSAFHLQPGQFSALIVAARLPVSWAHPHRRAGHAEVAA